MHLRELIKAVETKKTTLKDALKITSEIPFFIDTYLFRNRSTPTLEFLPFIDQTNDLSKIIMFKYHNFNLNNDIFRKIADYYQNEPEQLKKLISHCKDEMYLASIFKKNFVRDIKILDCLIKFYEKKGSGEYDSFFYQGLGELLQDDRREFYEKGVILMNYIIKKENDLYDHKEETIKKELIKNCNLNNEGYVKKENIEIYIEDFNDLKKEEDEIKIDSKTTLKEQKNFNILSNKTNQNKNISDSKIKDVDTFLNKKSFMVEDTLMNREDLEIENITNQVEYLEINKMKKKPHTIQACQKILKKNDDLDDIFYVLNILPFIISKTTKRMLKHISKNLIESLLAFDEPKISNIEKLKIEIIKSIIIKDIENILIYVLDFIFKMGNILDKMIVLEALNRSIIDLECKTILIVIEELYKSVAIHKIIENKIFKTNLRSFVFNILMKINAFGMESKRCNEILKKIN